MQSQIIPRDRLNFLDPVRGWLANRNVQNARLAQFLCWLIPAQCPFARAIKFGDRVLFEIPPLCKLNPFYDSLMELRFKSLVCLEGAQI